ncbi:hypothetical protein [Streptomyces sp. NPDC001828]|uniref:hypothetical protein n=1 Tax=Streptomyces sp. NPDC001828 TaxID=3364615 RepID=UPI0036AA7A1C
MAEAAKKTTAKKAAAKKTAAKKTTTRRVPVKKTAPPKPASTAKDLAAEIERRAEEKNLTPVAEGLVVEFASADPIALEALKDPKVSQAFNDAKDAGRLLKQAEDNATELRKTTASRLVDLRQLFKNGKDVDWDGQSPQYQALAGLLYQDLGMDASAQRAVRHHIEDVKRERIPKALWAKFNVQPLTRGQRSQLEKRAAQAVTSVDDARKDAGNNTAASMLNLARHIKSGTKAFRAELVPVMTTAQRRSLRAQLEETRAETDRVLAALAEVENDRDH